MSATVDVYEPPVTVVEVGAMVGARGPQGPAGAAGKNGSDGVGGPDGLSAYQVAVGNGFEGDETEWLESLVGPQGDQGPQGEPGAKGDQGDPGLNGDSADLPPAGENGEILTVVDGEWESAPKLTRNTLTVASIHGDAMIQLAPTARILNITLSASARVRIYRTTEQREADRLRAFTTLPQGDVCLFDVKLMNPGTLWANPQPIMSSPGGEFYVHTDTETDIHIEWEGN